MKRTVRLAILGVMLHGGAQATVQDVAAEPSLGSARHTRPAHPVAKKQKAVRGKKHKAARSGKVKSKPSVEVEPTEQKPKDKSGAVTANPPETIEQSVRLKGVRG
jgi:hypothetical protein